MSITSASRESILLVEDESDIRESLKEALESERYHIPLDLMMPVMSFCG